ncbi:DNA-processing protein DprA [Alkalihalobacterium chitinilyticum]|uniref:DNA-processing protein DprA n=1 Tax=Alkalihalobacterium chitinilyticum TaxID=2980103 RepID=A0ABT5VFJ6_9BACI|nr:DNA-processing protein DprA [Alkalihalobacterium chitinilyticum]MDE5412979.1 DNA-processing protein DprA [Alkalihalobacterium chitinilyticum]
MDIIKRRLIHFTHCRGAGWKTIYSFIQHDPTLDGIYKYNPTDLIHHFRMKENHANAFYFDVHHLNIDKIIKELSLHQITPITPFDTLYPPLLLNTYDPPWVLYCKGDMNLLKSAQTLAVVGTRFPSQLGLKSIDKLLPPIINDGWTIVSGLAEGIDTKAHELTMKLKGKTIGVLGSGLLHIYPRKNLPLAQCMSKEQLLVSEYPPHQKPQRWQFPERNRIISGLSQGILVVEAKEKSGALITADQGLEQGREVFAVPGSILEERSTGTNSLIQNGAKLVLNSSDILTELSC